MSWSRTQQLAAQAGSYGVEMIAQERVRQLGVEGWTPEHDDEHTTHELTYAAWCYLTETEGGDDPPDAWPWDKSWWKPSPDPVRNLVKAGALIAAEIDRLERRKRAER